MATELLAKWLDHYDPIHLGLTPRGIANGVSATMGWSFPRMRGGYNLYRGTASIEFAHPVGAGGAGGTSINNFAWRPHAANTTYWYAIKSIGGGGVESAASRRVRCAEFDVNGDLLGPRPNAVTWLSVKPFAGGRFLLHWVYAPHDEEASPAEFRVFYDDGSGIVDYETTISSVPFRRGRVHYEYTSAAFAHGATRRWAVRAVTDAGVDDGNTMNSEAMADAVSPVAVPEFMQSCLPES